MSAVGAQPDPGVPLRCAQGLGLELIPSSSRAHPEHIPHLQSLLLGGSGPPLCKQPWGLRWALSSVVRHPGLV